MNPAQKYPLLTALVIVTLLSACSANNTPAPEESSAVTGKESAGLFLARGSLFQKPEFEQYRFTGSALYVECGVFRGGRPQARSQYLLSLEQGAREVLQTLSAEAQTYISSEKLSLEKPEDSLGFADPGQASFSLSAGEKTIELKTTLDQVVELPRTSPLHKLAEGLRTVALQSIKEKDPEASALCDNKSFYGL